MSQESPVDRESESSPRGDSAAASFDFTGVEQDFTHPRDDTPTDSPTAWAPEPTSGGMSRLRLGLTACFYTWVAGCIVFSVFFNYQETREVGFRKWMGFGQVVPSLKGIAWPYFAAAYFVERGEFTRKERQELPHLFEALIRIRAFESEVAEDIRVHRGAFSIAVTTHVDEMISRFDRVSPATFEKVHAEYPTEIAKLIAGVKECAAELKRLPKYPDGEQYDGLSVGKPKLLEMNDKLRNAVWTYNDWVSEHSHELKGAPEYRGAKNQVLRDYDVFLVRMHVFDR